MAFVVVSFGYLAAQIRMWGPLGESSKSVTRDHRVSRRSGRVTGDPVRSPEISGDHR